MKERSGASAHNRQWRGREWEWRRKIRWFVFIFFYKYLLCPSVMRSSHFVWRKMERDRCCIHYAYLQHISLDLFTCLRGAKLKPTVDLQLINKADINRKNIQFRITLNSSSQIPHHPKWALLIANVSLLLKKNLISKISNIFGYLKIHNVQAEPRWICLPIPNIQTHHVHVDAIGVVPGMLKILFQPLPEWVWDLVEADKLFHTQHLGVIPRCSWVEPLNNSRYIPEDAGIH